MNEIPEEFLQHSKLPLSNSTEFKAPSFHSLTIEDEEYHYISDQSKKAMVTELAAKYNIDEKKIIRKIDRHVVLPFSLLFFVAFLNRTNLGYARVSGIEDSLDVSSFKIILGIVTFFVPYIILEIFSNLLLKIIRPHFWISISVFIYGIVTLSTGFIHTYAQFIGLEFVHGVFQAGTETAIYYIMANYYIREESQKRINAFYSVSCIAGLVGANVNTALKTHANGVGGLESWRWLFIVEGIISVTSSFVLFFTIPDFPEGATFFKDEETVFVIKRLQIYGCKSGYTIKSSYKDILKTVIDPMIIVPGLLCLAGFYGAYDYAFFEPILIQYSGVSAKENYKTAILPWLLGFVWVNINGFASDYFGIRYPFVIVNCILNVVACCLLLYIPLRLDGIDWGKISACYLSICVSYANIPLIIGWATMNLGGHLRKSTATAILVSMGNFSGLVAVFAMYCTKYGKGISGIFEIGVNPDFALVLFSLVLTGCYCFMLFRSNKKKRTESYKQKFYQLSEKQQILKGDKSPQFDYMF